MSAAAVQPKWPTVRWIVGELKYYAIAAAVAGFSAVGIGLILAIAHAAFDKTSHIPSPSAPHAEVPRPAPDRPPPTTEPPINISNLMDMMAWHQALTANTLDGYKDFILQFPENVHTSDAMNDIRHLLSDDAQLRAAEMQLADADSSLPLIAGLIKNRDRNPGSMVEFVTKLGFKYKYPFGYSIFYSDGTQLLSYEAYTSGPIHFDSSVSKVTFRNTYDDKGVMVCFDILPIRINGMAFKHIRNSCFGSSAPVMHAVRLGYISLDIEYLATSPRGVAWVIGMTP